MLVNAAGLATMGINRTLFSLIQDGGGETPAGSVERKVTAKRRPMSDMGILRKLSPELLGETLISRLLYVEVSSSPLRLAS